MTKRGNRPMLRTALLVVMTLTAVMCLGINCVAQDDPCGVPVPGRLFCDNFNDGNARDGIPGTWLPSASPLGTRDASSGDLVVTHSANMSTYVQELNGVRDLSIRAQLNFENADSRSVDYASIWARSPLTADVDDPAGYAGGIDTNGTIRLYHSSSDRVTTVLRSANTSIDPVNNDVFLQFDVFRNELSLTAWQDGQEKPASPQLATTDNRLVDGGQVGFAFNAAGFTDSATLRYFEVVPEPSSALLTVLGLLGLTVWRRQRSS
jgi:hypothetical protein